MLRTPSQTRPASLEDLLDTKLLARLDALDISSRKVFRGKLKGERRSKKRGESVEFADHRPYVVGDDLRHIDWNVFGRLDTLFMKLFMEEEDLSLHLVLDCSASSDTGEPNKLLFMQRVAMALGYIGLVKYNRVAVSAIGARLGDEGEAGLVQSLRDMRGKRRVHDMSRFICDLRPDTGGDESSPASFGEACRRIALSRRGKGIMVILSDMLIKEGYEDGLRMLVGRGYDLFVIQTLSPQELDPSITGDLRLKDIEDGDKAEITMSAPLLKKYKKTLAAYTNQLRDFCARREIMLVTVPSDTAVDTMVLDHLRRRGVVK
ncbi:MAG: DUF58 domain-containing protein [Phycisphaerales bacterium JB061]